MSIVDHARPRGRPPRRRPLRLEPLHPEVRALTRDAVIASRGREPRVTLQCETCEQPLARITLVPHGPLFTSWWETPVPRRGPRPPTPEPHGVIALLALPFGVEDDHPDLLVRCAVHGDAVLDRTDLVALLRRHKTVVWHVHPTMPRRRYRPLAEDWMGDVVEHPRRSWRWLLTRRLSR